MSPFIANIFLGDKITLGFMFRKHMDGITSLFVYFNIFPFFVKYLMYVSVSELPNLTLENTSEREQSVCVEEADGAVGGELHLELSQHGRTLEINRQQDPETSDNDVVDGKESSQFLLLHT